MEWPNAGKEITNRGQCRSRLLPPESHRPFRTGQTHASGQTACWRHSNKECEEENGNARGKDHQRWPNAYFDEHGLYSLNMAHARYVQSSLR